MTHLLRPNVVRPNRDARQTLDTPPTTDIDNASSQFDTESDIDSILSNITESDMETPDTLSPIPSGTLESLAMDAVITSTNLHDQRVNDDWSLLDETDIEEEAGFENFSASLESLSFDIVQNSRSRPRPPSSPFCARSWGNRSSSSPSHSPNRRDNRRSFAKRGRPKHQQRPESFYDYLFT